MAAIEELIRHMGAPTDPATYVRHVVEWLEIISKTSSCQCWIKRPSSDKDSQVVQPYEGPTFACPHDNDPSRTHSGEYIEKSPDIHVEVVVRKTGKETCEDTGCDYSPQRHVTLVRPAEVC